MSEVPDRILQWTEITVGHWSSSWSLAGHRLVTHCIIRSKDSAQHLRISPSYWSRHRNSFLSLPGNNPSFLSNFNLATRRDELHVLGSFITFLIPNVDIYEVLHIFHLISCLIFFFFSIQNPGSETLEKAVSALVEDDLQRAMQYCHPLLWS